PPPASLQTPLEKQLSDAGMTVDFLAIIYNISTMAASSGTLMLFVLFGTTKTAYARVLGSLVKGLEWVGYKGNRLDK
ncbi:hypothetical protein HK102_004700, partial [Quaeritorhiza haematococci]